jgi:hypothetical protein
MFVRPHKDTVKAFHKSQKKHKAYRLKTNAIIKKAVRDKNVLQVLYKYSEEDCLRKSGHINHLVVDLQEAEDDIKQLKEENMELKKRISLIDNFAMPILIWTSAIVTAFVNVIPQY